MAVPAARGKETLYGDVLIILVMALFGCYGLFIRKFPDLPILSLLVAFQVAGIVFLGYSARKVGWAAVRKRMPLLIALTACAIGNDITYFASFRYTSVANAALAHQSMSLFLLVFAPWLLREKTHRDEYIGLGVALLGFGVLYLDGVGYSNSNDFIGITMSLSSGLFMALVIVLYRKLPGDDMPMSAINLCRSVLGAIVIVPIFVATEVGDMSWDDVWPMAAFGVVFGVIGTMVHSIGISRTRSLHASILGKTEPVWAAFYAMLFLQEGLTLETAVGGALILGSSLWLTLRNPDASS